MGVFSPGELLGPRGGVTKCETAEDAANGLVSALGLSIGLRVKTGRETGRGSDKATKLPPEQRRELRTPIGDNVRGETMNLENLVSDDLGCLPSGGEFRKRDKVSGLRKAINNGEDYCVSLGRGKTSNKI